MKKNLGGEDEKVREEKKNKTTHLKAN